VRTNPFFSTSSSSSPSTIINLHVIAPCPLPPYHSPSYAVLTCVKSNDAPIWWPSNLIGQGIFPTNSWWTSGGGYFAVIVTTIFEAWGGHCHQGRRSANITQTPLWSLFPHISSYFHLFSFIISRSSSCMCAPPVRHIEHGGFYFRVQCNGFFYKAIVGMFNTPVPK
jgi:hypothetical protein